MSDGTCSVEGCGNKVQARGMCSKHYARVRRNGTTDTVFRQTGLHACSIEGCNRLVEALGLCHMHYARHLRGSQVATVPGTVRGGPLIERVRRRISPANADGCQVWGGPVTGNSELPIIRQGNTSLSVRRLVWADAHGQELGESWVVPTCSTPRCVAPEHLRVTTVSEFNRKSSDMVTSR